MRIIYPAHLPVSFLRTTTQIGITSFENGIDFISGTLNQVVSSFNLEYFFNQLDRYLLDKYSVSTDNIGNVSIQTDELDIVAEDLEQAPSYLIKVVKTY